MTKTNQAASRLKKYLLYSAAGLFVYMPFHIFLSQWLSTFTGGLDTWKIVKDLFTALVTILCVVTIVWKGLATKFYWWLLGLTAAYGLLHLLLIFTTNQPIDTGLLAATYNLRLFCYLIIGYSLSLLMPNKPLARSFVRILIVVSTIVCLVGLAQWMLPKDLMTHFGYSLERGVKPAFFIDDKPDLPRIMATIRDPNSLGAFLILPLTILVAALVKGWRTNRRMLLSGLVLLHGLALFLTFSRSAFVGAFLSLATLFGLTYGKRALAALKKPAILISVGIFCIATLGTVYALRDQYVVQNVVFHADENTKMTDSNDLHAQFIQNGIEGIGNQPLGHGPGTAGLVSIHSSEVVLTENYYVQIAYEVGIFGLVIFVALLALIIKTLWQSRNNRTSVYLLASFIGLAFMNLLLHTWANEAIAASWFMLAGLVLASVVSASSHKHKHR